MKTLITLLSLIMTTVICYGQSNNGKPVYSMKKNNPVISEENSEIRMDSTERQNRSSISMYKNVVQDDKNTLPPKPDTTYIRKPERELYKSTKN